MKEINDVLDAFEKIQALIVEKDPDDNDKFLREIWNLASVGQEAYLHEKNKK